MELDGPKGNCYPFRTLRPLPQRTGRLAPPPRRRTPLTVCIAAVCNIGPDSVTTVVTASDRMITIGELEYEPEQTKTVYLANQTVALCAGDMQLHAAIMPTVFERIRHALAENPGNINVVDIANIYAEQFAYHRRKMAEREILFPRGLDFDRFLTRQATMAHYQVRDLDDRLAAYYVNSTAIIAGLDPTGGHIYKISNPGVAECWDTPFFACTGSGEHVASTQFMVAGFEKRWSLAKTIWLTFSAKAKAEVAGGVGRQTDLVVIRPGGNISPATPEQKDRLYELFKQVTAKEAEAAQEAVSEIETVLQASAPGPTDAAQRASPEPTGDDPKRADSESSAPAKDGV
jgi:20S proteasome alpha/beta subunit